MTEFTKAACDSWLYKKKIHPKTLLVVISCCIQGPLHLLSVLWLAKRKQDDMLSYSGVLVFLILGLISKHINFNWGSTEIKGEIHHRWGTDSDFQTQRSRKKTRMQCSHKPSVSSERLYEHTERLHAFREHSYSRFHPVRLLTCCMFTQLYSHQVTDVHVNELKKTATDSLAEQRGGAATGDHRKNSWKCNEHKNDTWRCQSARGWIFPS